MLQHCSVASGNRVKVIMYGTATQPYSQHSLHLSQRTKLLASKSKPLIRSDPSPLDWQPGSRSNLLKVIYWISVPLIYRRGGKSWPGQQRYGVGSRSCPWCWIPGSAFSHWVLMSVKHHMNPGNHPWLGRAFEKRSQPTTVCVSRLVIALMLMPHEWFN